jgi:adenylosuccinate lyase
LKSQPLCRSTSLGLRALFTEAARFQSWPDVEAALAELTVIPAEMPDSSIHGMRIGLCFRR